MMVRPTSIQWDDYLTLGVSGANGIHGGRKGPSINQDTILIHNMQESL